jgi:Domain of unknown function (DUF4249)
MLTNYLIRGLSALVCALLFITCIQEIDFQNSDANQAQLVVNGAFTDDAGPHRLYLTRPGNYTRQAFNTIAGAQVILTDDVGGRFEYRERPDGEKRVLYELEGVQGVPGRTYTLEIKLPDGKIYRSQPQKMLPSLPLDDIEVTGEWRSFTAANGTVVRQPYAYAYARTVVPDSVGERYLHWDAEVVYIFNGILRVWDPFDPAPRQCFLSKYIGGQLVSLSDLKSYKAGARIRERIGGLPIDYAFESRICFIGQQRTIDRAAYDYWRKINLLITPNGTIFDTPPSPLVGNVQNTTDPEDAALGYFEVASVQINRVYLQDGSLGDGFLVQDNPYCKLDWNNWPPVNHKECDECLILPGSVRNKPAWWQ